VGDLFYFTAPSLVKRIPFPNKRKQIKPLVKKNKYLLVKQYNPPSLVKENFSERKQMPLPLVTETKYPPSERKQNFLVKENVSEVDCRKTSTIIIENI